MHSPFPWKADPRIPTAVFDANGNKIAATKEGHAFHPREDDDTTAADNAALIAALPKLVEALEFYRDGFQYHPARTSTGINVSTWLPKDELIDDCGETARATLASIGK